MAEHLRVADADTAALQARLDALESETHSLREVLTERLSATLGRGACRRGAGRAVARRPRTQRFARIF